MLIWCGVHHLQKLIYKTLLDHTWLILMKSSVVQHSSGLLRGSHQNLENLNMEQKCTSNQKSTGQCNEQVLIPAGSVTGAGTICVKWLGMYVASKLARADGDVEAEQILLQAELQTCCPSFILCVLPRSHPGSLQGVVLMGTDPFSYSFWLILIKIGCTSPTTLASILVFTKLPHIHFSC